ncbi:MAG: argininosuccinate lyase, partial [Planctomycetota bacterium]
DTVLASLELAAAMIEGAELKSATIAARLEEGYLDATTLMEQLILLGVPMRSAHEAVGTLVRKGIERGVPLAKLEVAEFEAISPGNGALLRSKLGVSQAIQAFQSHGSTAPKEVERQLKSWRERLGAT